MKYLTQRFLLIFFLTGITACKNNAHPEIIPLEATAFETTLDGQAIRLFTLQNTKGMACQITNYGGRVVSLWAPDREGRFEDIVLGYPDIQSYQTNKESYFGALIGRYGNRIAEGRFTLNDSLYVLATNNDGNHLHGGVKGYNQVVWESIQNDANMLTLRYRSPDGEEGYPGTLDIEVRYTLTEASELKISYKATTDKTTPVNLTHHSYFNLKGAGNGTILDHLLHIDADAFTPIKAGLIPTGEIAGVEGTPFDFRTPKPIGSDLNQTNSQLELGFGYDHNFVLNGSGLRKVARVSEPQSGRVLEVWTDEPGLQFYGGNFLDGSEIGKDNKPYAYRTAFCLETQHFPDSPNQEGFPTTLLHPGEVYTSTCIYKLTTE